MTMNGRPVAMASRPPQASNSYSVLRACLYLVVVAACPACPAAQGVAGHSCIRDGVRSDLLSATDQGELPSLSREASPRTR
jgi:hypothetical protein